MIVDRYVIGDCRDELPQLPDARFRCCVTSPPYFGLRDYGHERQIGLERTPSEYVHELVSVFREVRRLLKEDGTLWLVIGDTYANGRIDRFDAGRIAGEPEHWQRKRASSSKIRRPTEGLKRKDLVGIPWRVAFALQDDGWYLRSDIVWSKPTPIPESVTDRPTRAHEYIFLLSKSERYFYDIDALREPHTMRPQRRRGRSADETPRPNGQPPQLWSTSTRSEPGVDGHPLGRNCRSVWEIASEPYTGDHVAPMPRALARRCILAGSEVGDVVLDPFFGSGTVGRVAEDLGRHWLGIELVEKSAAEIAKRTAQVGLGI